MQAQRMQDEGDPDPYGEEAREQIGHPKVHQTDATHLFLNS